MYHASERRDNFRRDRFAHLVATGSVEVPMHAKVDAANFVLFDRLLQGEGLLPERASSTCIVGCCTVELIGNKFHRDVFGLFADYPREGFETRRPEGRVARGIGWKVWCEVISTSCTMMSSPSPR